MTIGSRKLNNWDKRPKAEINFKKGFWYFALP